MTTGDVNELSYDNSSTAFFNERLPETLGDTTSIGSLNFSTNLGTPGDAALTAIVGQQTNDAAVLEFQFRIGDGSQPGTVYMNYLFGSDEYVEFIGGSFNDVFAFFVDGQNIALVPSTTDAVSVATSNSLPAAKLWEAAANSRAASECLKNLFIVVPLCVMTGPAGKCRAVG